MIYKYITYCSECKKEIPVKNYECYFYEAKPYCYECRNKFIDVWVKITKQKELDFFDKSTKRKLKEINKRKD